MTRRLGLLLLLAVAAPSWGYETLKTSGGTPLRWSVQRFPVPYVLNDQGTPDAPLTAVSAALDASFTTWSAVPSASISFRSQGITTQTAMENDGVNLVRWFETGYPFDNNSLAVTVNTYNDLTGAILDADIHVNGFYLWSASAEPTRFDIQNVMTHEVGHVLGLAHTPVVEATMYADAAVGETKKRSLAADDLSGLSFLYPADPGDPDTGNNPGDVDGNRRVDGRDLVLLGTAFGAAANNQRYIASADFDGNGVVDGADLSVLASNYGYRY